MTEDLRRTAQLSGRSSNRVGDFRFDADSPEQFVLAIDGPYSQVVTVEMMFRSMDDLGRSGCAVAGCSRTPRRGLGDTINIQFPSLSSRTSRSWVSSTRRSGSAHHRLHHLREYIDFRLDRFLYLKVAGRIDHRRRHVRRSPW